MAIPHVSLSLSGTVTEVWGETDTQGGHLLAPAQWASAEIYTGQTVAAGAAANRVSLFLNKI